MAKAETFGVPARAEMAAGREPAGRCATPATRGQSAPPPTRPCNMPIAVFMDIFVRGPTATSTAPFVYLPRSVAGTLVDFPLANVPPGYLERVLNLLRREPIQFGVLGRTNKQRDIGKVNCFVVSPHAMAEDQIMCNHFDFRIGRSNAKPRRQLVANGEVDLNWIITHTRNPCRLSTPDLLRLPKSPAYSVE
jgi:hypothetical protein